jgi:hypothetical protein
MALKQPAMQNYQNSTKSNRHKTMHNPFGICQYVLQSKEFFSTTTKERFEMKGAFTYGTKGLIYRTTCSKCLTKCVGQTGRELEDRLKEQINCICLQHWNTLHLKWTQP